MSAVKTTIILDAEIGKKFEELAALFTFPDDPEAIINFLILYAHQKLIVGTSF